MVYASIAYALIWALGLGGFPDRDFVAKTRDGLSWPHAPSWLVIAGIFAFWATLGVVTSCVNALGEEIGWRGFLTPRLVDRLGFTGGALAVGATHVIWHLPLLLFSDYNNGTPWWFGMTCFTALVLSASIIWTWLRVRSGSLWTGVVFHASHNTFVQGFFTPATASKGPITAYSIDEFGFMLASIAAMLAVVFWIKRPKIDTGLAATR